MNLLDQFLQVLQQYDAAIKVLAAVAAPGGIWFWIDKFRNRIRVKIRRFGFAKGDLSVRGISFEVENIGAVLTSLEPHFQVVAYTPKRERQSYRFLIEGNDRKLPPHELKQIHGWHNNPENRVIAFGWYMDFKIPLTRGSPIRVRVRNAQFEQLGWLRFHWERLLFVVFKKTPS